MKTQYTEWTQIEWDGNPELKFKCWRKSFGRGHVSVGIGDFRLISYSYGPNSEASLSGTRWRSDRVLTEKQAMEIVDRNGGQYNHKDND